MNLSKQLIENKKYLESVLPLQESFDFIQRDFYLEHIPCFIIAINGFCNTELLQKILADLQSIEAFSCPETQCVSCNAQQIADKIGYAQVSTSDSFQTAIQNLLSGAALMLVEGIPEIILFDVRTYPTRGVEEPDMEHVTRGPRDGFVESLLCNTNLIRRRIRSPKLTFSLHHVGTESATDVSIAYVKGLADDDLVRYITKTLNSLRVTALTMGEKSLQELILPKRWLHPLPAIQSTERPDVACSYLLEGHVLIMVDNSPIILTLPGSIFQFTQNPEDYYSSPIVGSYLRLVRFLCIPISLLLLPVFLLFTTYYREYAISIGLLANQDIGPVRMFFYVIATEFLLDLFKYSSSLSSGTFSGALSIVGGLIISDIAVNLNWASPEVLFYGSLTLLASMSISDVAFANGIRLYRIFLILLTGFWELNGFVIGLLCVLLSVITTPTFGGYSYFWPLFPFNAKALMRILFRCPTPNAQPSKAWNRGRIRQNRAGRK